MNTRKEVIIQIGVFAVLIVIGLYKYAYVESYGFSGYRIFAVILFSFLLLVTYNFLVSGVWWIRKLFFKEQNSDLRKSAAAVIVLLVLLISPLFILPRIFEKIQHDKNHRILITAFARDKRNSDDVFKVIGYEDWIEYTERNQIKGISHDGDKSIIEYENGLILMAVYNYRKKVISFDLVSEPVAGGDAPS